MSDRMPNEADRRRSRTAQIAQAYRTANEVVSGAMALGLLAGGGAWLDHRYGWSPVLTITGAILGMVFAGASLRQLMRRLDQETAQTKRRVAEGRSAEGRSAEDRENSSGK